MGKYAKLFEIQQTLKAPKDQYNDFGGYPYRTCEGILKAVKPLLDEHECVLVLFDSIETAPSADDVNTGAAHEAGNRVYIKATARLVDAETDEIIAEGYGYAREPFKKKGTDTSQVTGAASTYARKYALNGLFAIDDGIDADRAPIGQSEDPRVKTIRGKLKAAKIDESDFIRKAGWNISAVDRMRGDELESVVKNIDKYISTYKAMTEEIPF